MNSRDKALFCQKLSSLFLRPTPEIAKEVESGSLYQFFKPWLSLWGEKEKKYLNGFLSFRESSRLEEELQQEYDRLFSEFGEEKIPLVESCYKPWTEDPQCLLPFAKEKGFLMGDPALHLLALFQRYGLEVEAPFQGVPDHLAIELEFLSFLYSRNTPEEEIRQFLTDHLNWIPFLREACVKSHAHPFYLNLIDILDRFIQHELGRLEKQDHGTKGIHSEAV